MGRTEATCTVMYLSKIFFFFQNQVLFRIVMSNDCTEFNCSFVPYDFLGILGEEKRRGRKHGLNYLIGYETALVT